MYNQGQHAVTINLQNKIDIIEKIYQYKMAAYR